MRFAEICKDEKHDSPNSDEETGDKKQDMPLGDWYTP